MTRCVCVLVCYYFSLTQLKLVHTKQLRVRESMV